MIERLRAFARIETRCKKRLERLKIDNKASTGLIFIYFYKQCNFLDYLIEGAQKSKDVKTAPINTINSNPDPKGTQL